MREARGLSSMTTGILCICAGALCLAVNDAFSKYLDAYYPVMEIIFFRMLFSLPLIVASGLYKEGWQAFIPRAPYMQIGRGVAAIAAPISYISALAVLPLGATAAISFASPLFITLFAVIFFAERPGWRQWLATGLGFAGVILVIQPGSAVFTWGAILPLGAAIAYAWLMISGRSLANRGDSIWVTMIYSSTVPMFISLGFMPWGWSMPTGSHWLAFIGAGLFGGAAITLITQAFRVGSASVVAPFDYTGLLWATFLGWIFWDEIPTPMGFLGMAVIVASGVYLALRQGAPRRRSGHT